MFGDLRSCLSGFWTTDRGVWNGKVYRYIFCPECDALVDVLDTGTHLVSCDNGVA